MDPTTAAEAVLTSFVLVGPFVAALRPRFPGPTDPGGAREGVGNRLLKGPGVEVEGHRPASRAAGGDLHQRRFPGAPGAVRKPSRYERVGWASDGPGP
jgi:hypothetical protein